MSLPEALCNRCCNKASPDCANECADGPVVECSSAGRQIVPRAPLPDFAVSDCRCEDLRAENQTLRGLLREVEWVAGPSCGDGCCPICGEDAPGPHASDCCLGVELGVL